MTDQSLRPVSRRHLPKEYLREARSVTRIFERRTEAAPPRAELLTTAGATTSALRRQLEAIGIDPKLARLLLLFERDVRLRPCEVAWQLAISPATASRWLDKAERLGLVDKFYLGYDRRGTWARTTQKGRELRQTVERILAGVSTVRPEGPAYGVRAVTRNEPTRRRHRAFSSPRRGRRHPNPRGAQSAPHG